MPSPRKQTMPLAGQIIIVFVLLAGLLPMVGSKFIDGQIIKEQVLVLRWFGPADGMKIDQRASSWFNAWAVRSGLMRHAIEGSAKTKLSGLFKMAHGPGTQNLAPVSNCSSKADCASAPTISIAEGARNATALPAKPQAGVPAGGSTIVHHLYLWWITAVFALAYFALLRLSTLLAWLPVLLPIMIALLVQAHAQRKLKWYSFGGISARQYRMGIRMSGWMLAIAMALFFAPGALPPVSVELCLLLSASGFALMLANGHKPT